MLASLLQPRFHTLRRMMDTKPNNKGLLAQRTKAAGSDELSFADSQQSRRRYATGGFALSPIRGRALVRTRQRWVSDQHRSVTPWSDCRQAYALAGTSPTYLRVLSVSRGFDRWARSCTTNSFSRMIIHSLATKNTVAGPKSATLLRVVLLRGLLRTSGGLS